jgi:hypothetical protein
MANEIDLVVGTAVKTQIATLMTELEGIDKKIQDIGKSAVAMNTALGVKDTASLTKLSAENAKLNKEIEKLIGSAAVLETKLANATAAQSKSTKATTDALIAEEKLIAAKQKNADTTQKNADKEIKASQTKSKYITQETIDIRLKNKELAQEYTELSKNAGAYDKHDAQYKKMAKSLKDMAFEGKAGTKEFIDQEKALTELGNRLKSVDAITGSHTRNVGNYASSWNGLGNSINQLTREAPAFANSLQTGFMALSNNIPILTDELGILINKNKQLQEQGKPTESILKTVAGAFFSWQTAISLGVTVLTVYGAKIYESLFGLSEAEKKQKEWSDAVNEANANITSQTTQLKSLISIVNDNTQSEKNRQLAYEEIKKTLPGLESATYAQAVATGELTNATDLYILSLIQKNVVEKEAKIIADQQSALNEETKKGLNERLDFVDKAFLFFGLTTRKEIEKTNAEIDKWQQGNIDKQAKALIKSTQDFLKTQKELAKFITEPKAEKTGKDKIAKEAAKKEEEIAKNAFNRKISDLEKQKELDKDALDSFSGALQERQILSATLAADEVKIVEAMYQEELRLANGNADLIAIAENNKTIAVDNIRDENIKRVQGYYKELEDIELEANNKSKKNQDDLLKELNNIVDKDEEDKKKKREASLKEQEDYLQSFADEFASKSGLTETFKMMSGQIEGFGEDTQVTFNAVAEASQEMFNKIASFSQAHYEQDYARLEAQKEASLKFAGDSSAAKEKIEKDFAEKKKEIDKKKFEEDKKISMVNIVIDTAQAIMATYKKTGFFGTPLAIIMGAFGAAQLAMVAAQQFPAYAEGTDNHKGGLMLVNDGAGSNFQEKVILPSGKVIRPQGRNVLMDAPKGTKVLNHEQQLFEMLQSNNISMSNPQYQGMTPDEMDEILGKHFSNIKTQNTIFDKNGFQSYVKNGNSITRSNSNRSQAIGISV